MDDGNVTGAAPGDGTGAFALFDLLADPTIVIDQDLRIVAANAACARLIGSDVERWIGEVPLELVHPSDLPIVLSSFSTVAEKEYGTPIEVRIRVADGT